MLRFAEVNNNMSDIEETEVLIDQYAVYAEFGIAAEKAQILELEAGNFAIAFLTIFFDPNQLSAGQTEMFRSIMIDLNRKTFGRLLKHVKAVGTIDESILQTMDYALERRNYLTHRFFSAHNFALYSLAGRKDMIAELKDIQSTLDRALTILQGMTHVTLMIAQRDGTTAMAEQLKAEGKRVKL